MLYSDWVTALAAELAMSWTITNSSSATPSTVADFNNILPRCIEFTENMMIRDPDLDFLQIRAYDTSTTTVAGSRTLQLPTTMYVPFEMNIISPAGTTNPQNGTRTQVLRSSIAWINMNYPTETGATGIPAYWALTDANITVSGASGILQARLGQTPDQAYTVEWYGQTRPTPLSATNTSNFLTINLPDLYLAASMIFMSGFIRNFGAQADDPKMALSWMQVYEAQKKGAAVEQARIKAQSAGWTAWAPTPVATPPRM